MRGAHRAAPHRLRALESETSKLNAAIPACTFSHAALLPARFHVSTLCTDHQPNALARRQRPEQEGNWEGEEKPSQNFDLPGLVGLVAGRLSLVNFRRITSPIRFYPVFRKDPSLHRAVTALSSTWIRYLGRHDQSARGLVVQIRSRANRLGQSFRGTRDGGRRSSERQVDHSL